MVNDFLPRGRRPRSGMPVPQRNTQAWHPQPAAFSTPEQTSASNAHESSYPGGVIVGDHGKPPKHKKSLKERFASITKKQWIIIGIISLLFIGGAVVTALILSGDEPATKKQQTTKKTEDVPTAPAPTIVPSKLTGLPVDPSFNERQVTAVMIENSLDARPQSGLAQAGVVFEAVAEGGITRFLTLFQDDEPDYVGPVRSVRPYYVQWLRGFDAAVAHVGGSADALAMLKRGEAKDLDQFRNPAPFWRVSNRFAPHNMYTSIPRLNELESSRGYTKSDYNGFARKDKETPNAAPNATKIDFNISGAIYNAHYDYDSATNSYKRSEGGKPHTDERTGAQLSPKVVVGLVMPQGKNGIYTTYETIGNGQAYIFQDGVATTGTWTKTSNAAQFTFKDSTGADIKLNPGQTWVTVVGGTNRVTYAP